MSEFVNTLEKEARSRFVRWDPALWQGFLSGPVARMGQALAAGGDPAQGEEILRAYLRLGAEGIGLGYLYPASAGRQNFFTLAWSDLVPRLLPALPGERQAPALARMWNLSENMESAPPWVQRLFCRMGATLRSLDDIEGHLHAVANEAMEPPTQTLGDTSTALWVDLSQEDSRFMPGEVHFLAPAVVCVHDRHRATAAGGRDAATQGVWLSKKPMLLGPMGCNERLEPSRKTEKSLTSLAQRDPRAGDWYSTLSNEWRAVATMHTSQWLAVILPT
ncbi:hypothetical protein OV208_04455 [Corallococcus sp. bb12-1]|uniref:hypothetical protein n=1 Tax=Corallococcus sp. bb12-1 TaxID=2996784 RepID=UPI002271461E|nr:hypothetical protein [Corallococcus sp. bb12-1]MCY1040566.1 hypothetical protein [Corallococcus sp. bb12-1]